MFKDYLIDKLRVMSSVMDGDMYYQRGITGTGEPYYVISYGPQSIMRQIGSGFDIKNDKWGRRRKMSSSTV